MGVDLQHEFDNFKEGYVDEIERSISFSGQEHDFYLKLKADHFKSLLTKEQSDGNKLQVLDVGCGHGLFHKFLKDMKHINLRACDPAASVIDFAKQQNLTVDYVCHDGNVLPYADNTFDVAFTICVMHHVHPEQWPSFLDEIKRVVKSNGLIVIYEHNPYNPLTRHIVKNCPIDENAVLLKRKQLNQMLLNAGLTKIKSDYIIFFPFKGKVFRKLEKMIRWLPLGAQYSIFARV